MEAPITASPHTFDPMIHYFLPPEEKRKIYRKKRVNELVRPYTVIDVITKVYHRSFANDLSDYIGSHTDEFARFKRSDDSWAVSRVWVNECRFVRPESIFDQPKAACYVDILVEARIRIEETKRGGTAPRCRPRAPWPSPGHRPAARARGPCVHMFSSP